MQDQQIRRKIVEAKRYIEQLAQANRQSLDLPQAIALALVGLEHKLQAIERDQERILHLLTAISGRMSQDDADLRDMIAGKHRLPRWEMD